MAKEIKNTLETYCYDMKDKVSSYGSLEKNIDPKLKDGFIAEVEECVAWLYDAGENAPLEEY